MPPKEFKIKKKLPADNEAISALLARAFGPGRFARSAYRVRELSRACDVSDELDLCAWKGNRLAGAIHFSKVTIGGEPGALMLGPLAIDPENIGQGCGQQLIEQALQIAEKAGYRLVVLVGDLSYYGKLGFQMVSPGRLSLPGPVDPARLLVRELESGAAEHFAGEIRPDQT